MSLGRPLSVAELGQAKAICDEICERFEADDSYTCDIEDRRGTAVSFPTAIWDHALLLLRSVGYDAQRTGAIVRVVRGNKR